MAFTGFDEKAFTFLRGIKKNNNKMWFEEHRAEYEEYVLEPLRELAIYIGEQLNKIDKNLVIDPRRAVSRIYRDVRFSKSKLPYKSHMWVGFKWNKKIWEEAPGFFFGLEEDGWVYGMGMYSVCASTLRKYRELIEDDVKGFGKIIEKTKKYKNMKLYGDKYKRITNDKLPADILDWYSRKAIGLIGEGAKSKITSKACADEAIKVFMDLQDLHKFLLQLK